MSLKITKVVVREPEQTPKRTHTEEAKRKIRQAAKARWARHHTENAVAIAQAQAQQELVTATAQQLRAALKVEEVMHENDPNANEDSQILPPGPVVGDIVPGADIQRILAVLGLPSDLFVVKQLADGYVTDMSREMVYAIYMLRGEAVRRKVWEVANNRKVPAKTRLEALKLLHTCDTDDADLVQTLGLADAGKEHAWWESQLRELVAVVARAVPEKDYLRVLEAIQGRMR